MRTVYKSLQMFAKLFSRITESSLMEEDIPVRYVFVMLLAISDKDGDVVGTDIAIARRLNMPVDEFARCVAVLGTPDPNSNSKAEDGRRVVPCDSERGYRVVNYAKYRAMTTEFQKKEYMRQYMAEYRKRHVKLTDSNNKTPATPLVPLCLTSASASESASESSGIKEGAGNHQGVAIGNLPTDEQAAGWLSQARENGADYTAAEMRSALLALRANGGMWGKNPIVDWRSGLERQIQFDRRTGGAKGPVVPARPDHSKGF